MTKSRVEPWVAELVRRDIEDAIARKDPASLRNFAAEARASGMVSEADRADEVISLLESWEAKAARAASTASARAELTRIKSVGGPRPRLDVAELIRRDDAEKAAAGAPFHADTYEQDEARRVEYQNRQLAERNRGFEKQRARQVAVGEPEPETPWWRR